MENPTGLRKDSCSYIASLLSLQGYRVSHVADGQSALRMVEADPGIRLVIVDQEMPGMDGIELTRRLRQLRRRAPRPPPHWARG